MQLLAKFKKILYMGFRTTTPHSGIMKMLQTCSPVIGQVFDAIFVSSIDKAWL